MRVIQSPHYGIHEEVIKTLWELKLVNLHKGVVSQGASGDMHNSLKLCRTVWGDIWTYI